MTSSNSEQRRFLAGWFYWWRAVNKIQISHDVSIPWLHILYLLSVLEFRIWTIFRYQWILDKTRKNHISDPGHSPAVDHSDTGNIAVVIRDSFSTSLSLLHSEVAMKCPKITPPPFKMTKGRQCSLFAALSNWNQWTVLWDCELQLLACKVEVLVAWRAGQAAGLLCPVTAWTCGWRWLTGCLYMNALCLKPVNRVSGRN